MSSTLPHILQRLEHISDQFREHQAALQKLANEDAAAWKACREALLAGETTGDPLEDLVLCELQRKDPGIVDHFKRIDQDVRNCPRGEWILVGAVVHLPDTVQIWASFGVSSEATSLQVSHLAKAKGVFIPVKEGMSFCYSVEFSPEPRYEPLRMQPCKLGPSIATEFEEITLHSILACTYAPFRAQSQFVDGVCAIGNANVVNWFLEPPGTKCASTIIPLLNLPQELAPSEALLRSLRPQGGVRRSL